MRAPVHPATLSRRALHPQPAFNQCSTFAIPATGQVAVGARGRPLGSTRTTAGVLSYVPQAQVIFPPSIKWAADGSAGDYAE
jgi:hypothetical protein